MKQIFFFTICFVLAKLSFTGVLEYVGLNIFPECMTTQEILKTTKTLCKEQQRLNRTAWNAVIKCHRPIDDTFLRASGEAQCTNKYVQQPNNTAYSIEEVFFNFCANVDDGLISFGTIGLCTMFGRRNPYIMSRSEEVRRVKETWGHNVPCDIGKCILALNIPTD